MKIKTPKVILELVKEHANEIDSTYGKSTAEKWLTDGVGRADMVRLKDVLMKNRKGSKPKKEK